LIPPSEIKRDYPKGYDANMLYRRDVLVRADRDPDFKRLVRHLFFNDPLFAFNTFFFTLDVRKRPRHDQPFCTYPYQDDFIIDLATALTTGEDRIVDKSRDMGVSWLVILVFLWFWLNPEGGADFLLGSRIEDYVDKKGDMRTLMQKARYALYRLPGFLKPAGFLETKHDNYMKLVNPETGSALTGESSNPNFSTGGRYRGILYDEFAKWDNDEAAWTAGGDATPSRIAVSTAFGAGGQFYRLVTLGKYHRRLHWTLHPEKAAGAYCYWPKDEDSEYIERSPWFDKQEERRSPLEIAQELNIDYIGAGRQVFDGKAAIRLRQLAKAGRDPLFYMRLNFASRELEKKPEPRDDTGYLRVFAEPHYTTSYAIGVDVVEGVENGDFAVIKVMDRGTKSCVASYYSRLDEAQLAHVIEAIAKYYTVSRVVEMMGGQQAVDSVPPVVCIETVGPGLSTFDICMNNGVDNLFMMPKFDALTGRTSYSKGWKTNAVSRNVLITGVREWLLDERGWVDTRCVGECNTFVRNKSGKAEAQSGTHDDEVLAWGMTIQADLLTFTEEYAEPVRYRADGLTELVFDPPDTDDEKTPHELCLETIEQNKIHPEDIFA
jgi:hypothetical protein